MQIHQQLVDEFQTVANIFCCRLPLRVASLCVGLCAGYPFGAWVSFRYSFKNNSLLIPLRKSKHNFAHFDRKAIFFGQKAQKHSARAERQLRPELIASNHFRHTMAKAFRCVICSEKGCYRFAFRNID